MRRPAFILIPAVLAAGCAPSPSRGIADDDAAYKIPAIKDAVVARDKQAPRQMIEDLEDDDPAIRFYAIEGLRRLTGETFGYRYYDHEETRKPAVDRWKIWLAEREGK